MDAFLTVAEPVPAEHEIVEIEVPTDEEHSNIQSFVSQHCIIA
ncbi:B mating type pheromone precursor [Gelatoporia subvermispora B]|uniref:B mating type pheromone n=1 Tax=Ceriporiopsis subvermispora (strain B) TaxID=914234 RepID=M2R905_CERS8|nr:B mating type pheromone precursor [Gelatoporia subvermispora B]